MNLFRRTTRPDDSPGDEEAMRRVRADGDHAAFGVLVERWEPKVRRLCVRMSGDEHRGEDLAQEAFARVFAGRQRYDPARKFSTWLWRIALNLCYEESRRRGVREEWPLDPKDGGAAQAGPLAEAEASERAAMVRDALARLPDAHRAVVVLRQYEALTFREIAEVLNAPEGTVKWRMTEALDRLARELRPLAADDGAQRRGPRGATAANETTTEKTLTAAKASVAL